MIGKKCTFDLKVTNYNIGREEYLVTKLTCVKNEETQTGQDGAKNGDVNQALSTTEHGALTKKRMANIDDDQLDNIITKTKDQHRIKQRKFKDKDNTTSSGRVQE